jgi:hypothetical protein
MTESSKPFDFEADARERQVVANNPDVQALRIITIKNLRQHVLDLTADLRIEWTDRFVKADPEIRTLRLHPIKSEKSYAAALHEIGYVRTGRFDDALIEARRAWEWARANALVWTPTMQCEADSYLGGSTRWIGLPSTTTKYPRKWTIYWTAATRTGSWSTTR